MQYMECNGPISCAITDLIEQLANPGWNWNEFTSTAIAALLGSLVGAAAVLAALAVERRGVLDDKLDDAAASAIVELSLHAGRLREHLEQYQIWAAQRAMGARPENPDGSSLGTSMEILQMRARHPRDKAAAASTRATLHKVLAVNDIEWVADECGVLQRVLRAWRSRELDHPALHRALQIVDERCALKHRDSNSTLPALPI
jgi:hypothetical protein